MTTARLRDTFAALAARDRCAFITYVMAGDPDHDTALEILRGLPAAGADIIEVGFPFSDPMADGLAIQASALRSLAGGGSLSNTLNLVRAFREENATTPIVLMGYANPLLNCGYAEFASQAAEAGVDGLIVVDIPPEEAGPIADELDRNAISLIRLATPTSEEQRLGQIAERSSGFVYYVSVAGVTGAKEAQPDAVGPAVTRVRGATNLPVVVGFGVRTPKRAAAIARIADGVVVGSALVEDIARAKEAGTSPVQAVLTRAQTLAKAIHNARE